ncbi:hypothetical protein LTR28_005528 [Elasticomyces elasticus]|nr:hypothetical protein LTR28_005528 [Elasticomyces elasticus]
MLVLALLTNGNAKIQSPARGADTGEHITDSTGALQYIPFPTCNETGRPLELYFGIEGELNCTIDFISDPLFHLLEFYVHNDAPLTCRIPARPPATIPQAPGTYDPAAKEAAGKAVEGQGALGGKGNEGGDWVPMVVALTGQLQLSHVHVANRLNVLLHAAPRALALGTVSAATAYSVADPDTGSSSTKIVIGDPLPLRLSVRWYPTTSLPSGWDGAGAGRLRSATLLARAI